MTPFKHRETIEFLKWEAIKAEQERLLQQHLAYAESYSPYYRKLFQSHTIQSNKISLDSLHTLPLTDKTCLAEQNGDFLAVPMSKIVDIVLSSGTTGKPTTIMYTEDDLQRLEYNEVISFTSCGLTSDDVVL
ncbi:MAG: phenylacetate--CoA ligase family protein, partial [Nitrospirota bacterium]